MPRRLRSFAAALFVSTAAFVADPEAAFERRQPEPFPFNGRVAGEDHSQTSYGREQQPDRNHA